MENTFIEFLKQKIETDKQGKRTLVFKCKNNCDQSVKLFQMALLINGKKSKRLNYGFENLKINPGETYEKKVPVNFNEKGKFEYEIIVTKIVCHDGSEWEHSNIEKSEKQEIDWDIKKKSFFVIDSLANYEYEDETIEENVNHFFDNIRIEEEEKPNLVPLDVIRNQKIRKLGIMILGLISAILLVVLLIHNKNQANEYIKALDLISRNHWDEAYETFKSIDGYSDSSEYIARIEGNEKVYKEALEKTNRMEWEIAAKLLMSISEYKNSEALYRENPVIVKEKANKLVRIKDYSGALDLYDKIHAMENVEFEIELAKKSANEDYLEYFKLIKSGEIKKAYAKYGNLKYKYSNIVNLYLKSKILYSNKIANKEPSEIKDSTIGELKSLIVQIPDSYKGDLKNTILGYKLELQTIIEKIESQKIELENVETQKP